MRHKYLAVVSAVLLLALASMPAFAQGTATSSITGVVVDSGGGFVPGATVIVKSESTGAESTAVTPASGSFTVPALNVGNYTVTVSLQGFKTAVLKGVTVTAGIPATVRAVLEIGGVTETVVVEGASQVIQTQSAASATTINTKAITNLPVSSRSALDFTQFLPGVQTSSSVRNSTVNGLPQSSISITLDGVNIQDNTLKTTDGFFAIVSPRLDAIEEVSLTSAAQGADATGQGGVQIRFTTRSGSNAFSGSGYHFYQSDALNTNTYNNRVRGLPKGELTLNQPGIRQGGPVYIPGVFDGRGKLFFFVNYEETRQPRTLTTENNLLLPDAQNGIFRYNGGPAGGVDLYALARNAGVTSTPDPLVGKLLQDIRNSTTSGGVLSEITGSFNTERYSFQQPAGGPVYYPTVRMDYNLSSQHRVSGTWYRQRFTDRAFDTTNNREADWPGFPLYGTQGSWREAYTTGLRSSLNQNLVNDARVAYSGAPVQFGPYHDLNMYTGTLANQNGFALGLNASCGNNCSLGISNAGPAFTPSARNATTLNVSDTLTWLRGAHSISLGGEFGQYDVWLDTYGSRGAPSITFGTATADPARAMFNSTNFPGSSSTDRNTAAALYAMLTGRATQIGATARLTLDGQYVYQGDSRAEGRLRQADLFIQDNWRMRPNLSVNLGLRYAMQLPFYARNSSYSTVSVDDVWGISGYKPGCDMSNPTPANCNLFQQGVMTGVSPPTYENLGKGVKAYNTDWDNIAPSVGVNWTPAPGNGWRRMLLGDSGESSISGGFSRAYDRRGMNDFTGRFGNNPGLTVNANRNVGKGNLTVPLLLRDGFLGPPATCPPLPAPKPTGCLVAAPEYPLTNQDATGSVNMFDPNLQVPYSDSWTVGFQRALGRTSAIEIRYVGTRSRQQWETFNYNEANILDNGFLDEFKLAQANLQSHIAAGCGAEGNECSFAYRGPGTGTSPLPIYLAFFNGVARDQAGDASRYTSSSWTNSNFVNPLSQYDSNPFTPAGTNSDTGLAGNPTRQANAIRAGLPANFFRVNPDMLGGANATGNRGSSKYNALQLQYRRRLSGGLQFDANYSYGRGTLSEHFSFRVPRVQLRAVGGEGDVTHGFKSTGFYELPFGQGKRFGTGAGPLMDRLIGGWTISGTTRIQSGRLFDLGNVRVVGMSENEVRDLFKLRFENDTVIYAWPQAIIDETIKAFSTSATSPTGYGALGTPSGKYFAPANGPDCIETIPDYGDCGLQAFVLTGPIVSNVDMSVRKRVKLAGRVQYEFSLDIFNVFNRVTFVPTLGIGNTDLDDWQLGLPSSARTMQIGTRITW
ncbi:MAG TPA: carboxypeptidase regulatory-like domain-containing protein [Vicinamibacterales bacterium]|nr:carboxypeptidase regulatory-like domain-containing protein [Vicinamibacterales bacterium]